MLIKLSKGGNEEYVELLNGSKRYFKDLKGDTRVLDPDYDRIEELNEDFEKFRKHLEKIFSYFDIWKLFVYLRPGRWDRTTMSKYFTWMLIRKFLSKHCW